jgi:hypothetical protein
MGYIADIAVITITRLRAHSSLVVKALRYKPKDHWFQTPRGKSIFSICLVLPAALCPGMYSAPKRNEHKNVSGE